MKRQQKKAWATYTNIFPQTGSIFIRLPESWSVVKIATKFWQKGFKTPLEIFFLYLFSLKQSQTTLKFLTVQIIQNDTKTKDYFTESVFIFWPGLKNWLCYHEKHLERQVHWLICNEQHVFSLGPTVVNSVTTWCRGSTRRAAGRGRAWRPCFRTLPSSSHKSTGFQPFPVCRKPGLRIRIRIGSVLVFSLKCWIRIRMKWMRIRNL